MRSILVIGGAGYIGSHAAKLLKQQGFEPVVLDDLSTGHKTAVKYGPLCEGSYLDAAFVESALRTHKIDTVMHFGAKALVGESVANPLLYYQSNVSGTLSILSAMKNVGVKNFIFSSTAATFGQPDQMPIHEEVEQQPVNPYGHSKLFVERILSDVSAADGLNFCVLRYFNAAGADPDGELGEDHHPETHLIPRALKAALGNEAPLTIFGSDYATHDGSCVRDYVHVNDLAEAHILAMKLLWEKNSSFNFNLGSENGNSVFEVVNAISKVIGKKLPYSVGPRRTGDPAVLIADSSKARKTLGWKPRFDLDAIVSTAYRWLKEHPNGYEK